MTTKHIIDKRTIIDIRHNISKNKDNRAYINIDDITDHFNIKDPRYIRFVMAYHLIKYGLIVELANDQKRLSIRIATDDEFFRLTGILVVDRKKKDEQFEPLYADTDMPKVESIFGIPMSEMDKTTKKLAEGIKEKIEKRGPLINLDVEYLSKNDVDILSKLEDCLILVWGNPEGCYETVTDSSGNVLYEDVKEKEKIIEDHRLDNFIEDFYVFIFSIMSSEELPIYSWNEWKLLPMIKRKGDKTSKLSQHDIGRLELIVSCFTDLIRTEKTENIHIQNFIEDYILDLNYMIEEKEISDLFHDRPHITQI